MGENEHKRWDDTNNIVNVRVDLLRDGYYALKGLLFKESVSFNWFVSYMLKLALVKDERILKLIKEAKEQQPLHIASFQIKRTSTQQLFSILEKASPLTTTSKEKST